MKEEINKAGFAIKDWDKVLKNKRIDIIADSKQMKVLLKRIGHNVDERGYIIDAKTGRKVKSNDGKEIKIKELGAVLPGTKNFVRKNVASFSHFLAKHYR